MRTLLLLMIYLFGLVPLLGDVEEADSVGYAHHIYDRYIPAEVLKFIEPYLIPVDHPIKIQLDELFSASMVLHNMKSLVSAGFEKVDPQPNTQVIVTRHASFPGYIFKLYLNEQKFYYKKRREFETWALRARGVRLLQAEIDKQGWQAYFKAPCKWIYPIPQVFFDYTTADRYLKNFILVEDEMDILSHKENKRCWNDGTVKTESLDMLFHLVKTIGLCGGCKLDNIPLCRDGRIAFIDTENNQRWPVPYHRLYKGLKGKMARHWKMLVKNKVSDTSPGYAHRSIRYD